MDPDELSGQVLAALAGADTTALKQTILLLHPLAVAYLERKAKDRARKSARSAEIRGIHGNPATPLPSLPSPCPPTPPLNPSLPSPPPASHGLTAPEHVAAYERFVAAANVPASVVAGVRAVVSPPSGGAAFPWPIVGQALVEMEAGGSRFNVEALRGFCRRLVRPAPSGVRASTISRQDKNLAAITEGLERYGKQEAGRAGAGDPGVHVPAGRDA